MKDKSLTKLFFTVLFSLTSAILFAQNTDSISQTNVGTVPVWIKMMNDPYTNYYDAVKAYDEYWKDHVKPAGEEEELNEGKSDLGEMKRETKKEIRKDKNRILTIEEQKTKNDNEVMTYQVKRFEQWMREVKPFVQEDGRILTDAERMQIWNKQQEEIKKQKK